MAGIRTTLLNAREAHRAVQLLSALSGNLGLRGGKLALMAVGSGWPVRMNSGPVTCPDGIENVKGVRPSFSEFFDNFKKPGESKYKAFLNMMGNPVQLHPTEIVDKRGLPQTRPYYRL
jgi:anaerobic selenocysteine-containing dehydrogenase